MMAAMAIKLKMKEWKLTTMVLIGLTLVEIALTIYHIKVFYLYEYKVYGILMLILGIGLMVIVNIALMIAHLLYFRH